MKKVISQRELRNAGGAIMRALDRGESFVITRNGIPVGELRPLERRRFVSSAQARAAFSGAEPIDAARFREDLDSCLDQTVHPRG